MVYHLSHIDLDGYFCQYLSTKKYKQVKYFNSNYGKDIYSNLKKIFKQSSKDDLILITDLNLEYKECEYIQKFVDQGYSVKLYDHHTSGYKFSKLFEWYYLNSSKSASAIFSEKEDIDSSLLDAVNSYDMWDETDSLDLGCYLSEFINKDHLFYFNEEKINFLNSYFSFVEDTLKEESNSIQILEKKEINFLQLFLKEYSGTIKQKLSEKYFNNMFKQAIHGKYIFLYDIHREYFQYISQLLLTENNKLIIVLILKNGRLSFRSRTEDVNILSSSNFNGSGHENASGGSLPSKHIQNKEEGISLFLNELS